MRFLITSDVHGRLDLLEEVIKKHHDIDYHLNAGDMVISPLRYERHHIITVKGNNDYGVDLPYVRIWIWGGSKSCSPMVI